MIIDSHCHGVAGFGLNDPWTGQPLLVRYLRRAQSAGITHSVIFANFHDDYAKANQQVARFVRQYPQRLMGLCYLHAARDKGRIFSMLKTAVEDYGFVGIKVHRKDARITREICDAARVFRVPILYDVETELDVLDWLARDYPDLNFIVPHLSSFAEKWRSQAAFLDRLEAYPNLYTDTSGVRFFDLLMRVVERCGPHKLLFGSDGPWLHPGVELAKIKAMGLAPAAQALVVGGNFLRLTGLSKPGGRAVAGNFIGTGAINGAIKRPMRARVSPLAVPRGGVAGSGR